MQGEKIVVPAPLDGDELLPPRRQIVEAPAQAERDHLIARPVDQQERRRHVRHQPRLIEPVRAEPRHERKQPVPARAQQIAHRGERGLEDDAGESPIGRRKRNRHGRSDRAAPDDDAARVDVRAASQVPQRRLAVENDADLGRTPAAAPVAAIVEQQKIVAALMQERCDRQAGGDVLGVSMQVENRQRRPGGPRRCVAP